MTHRARFSVSLLIWLHVIVVILHGVAHVGAGVPFTSLSSNTLVLLPIGVVIGSGPLVALSLLSTRLERDRNRLPLAPSQKLSGLSVFQIDQPHQHTLAHAAIATAREGGVRSSAVFGGTGGRDVANFTQWMSRQAYEQAPQSLMKPPKPDLYQIALVDHITGQGASHLAIEDGLFHFINVFPLVPGKRDDLIDFFEHTIRIVRVQPGYVSTNLLVSLDDRHAANIGQFKTRQDFLAMMRRPRVLLALAQVFRRQIVQRRPRLRQYDLLDVSLYQDSLV